MKKLIAVLLALLFFLLLTPPAWATTVTRRIIIMTPESHQFAAREMQRPARREKALGGGSKSTTIISVPDEREHTPQGSIEQKIRAKFGKWGNIAVAIATCESGMRADAIGDGHLTFWQDGVEYGYSVGPFQIRTLPGRPSADKLLIPDFNIQYAYDLFLRSGFQPWSCFTNKGYLAYL